MTHSSFLMSPPSQRPHRHDDTFSLCLAVVAPLPPVKDRDPEPARPPALLAAQLEPDIVEKGNGECVLRFNGQFRSVDGIEVRNPAHLVTAVAPADLAELCRGQRLTPNCSSSSPRRTRSNERRVVTE